MCPFTASRAFRWAALAVAPLFFQNRQLWTCFDGSEAAGPHIDLSTRRGSAHRDLPSLAPPVEAEGWPEQDEVSLPQLNTTNTFWIYLAALCEDRSTNKRLLTVSRLLLLLLQSSKCIRLYLRNASEKINIPRRDCRLFHMSSITHSHWAICNSHLGFEGSWALNREEFPFEGRICWNRPMIISILMAL